MHFSNICVSAQNWTPLLSGLRGAAGDRCLVSDTGRGEGRFLGGLVPCLVLTDTFCHEGFL